jgi:hypothetical protein
VAPATETGGIPISTITNMLAERAPTREEIFGGYTPDPMSIGVIASGLGTDAAIHPYTQMLNAEKAMTGQVATGAASRKATADLIGAVSDIPYKRAQAAEAMHKIKMGSPEMQVFLAGAKKEAETTNDLVAKSRVKHLELQNFVASDAGKVLLSPDMQKITGVKTQGQAAAIYGIDKLYELAGHTSAMENARVMAASAIRAQDVNGLRQVEGSLTDAITGVNREITKLMTTPTTAIETVEQKAERENTIKALNATKDGYTEHLSSVRKSLVGGEQPSTNKGGDRRGRKVEIKSGEGSKPTSAKAAEARAYGIPETIPKGTGIPQDYKGKTIYIFEGAAYDADGNFISIITDKRKKR